MKILHVVEATFAGVGRHVIDLASAQATDGHDVHVAYSPIREGGTFSRERQAVHEIGWHPLLVGRGLGWRDATAQVALHRLVRALLPEVLHGHSTKGGLLVRSLPRPPGRVVYTPNAVYSMNPLLSGPARQAARLTERVLAPRTDVIIAVSPEEASHLRSIGVGDDRLRLVPNGIAPVEPASRTEVRRSLGLPERAPVVGFVGRIDDQKAPDDLLSIFAAVGAARPDTHFVVVGDGPRRAEIEQSVAASVLGRRLHLVGQQPGTWAMSAFDLLVLPSRYEGFPYVLIEAAHLGLPIVTTHQACASLLAGGPVDVRIGQSGAVMQLARLCLDLLDRQLPGRGRRDRRFSIDTMWRLTELAYLGEPAAAPTLGVAGRGTDRPSASATLPTGQRLSHLWMAGPLR